MTSTKENDNETTRRSFPTIPVPYIAIGFAIFSATVTAIDYTLGRIEDNTKQIAVQEERGFNLGRELMALQAELSTDKAQLDNFKSQGARFTAEDGERLRVKIEDLQQRTAAIEAILKNKGK
jgi:hypothetical protein